MTELSDYSTFAEKPLAFPVNGKVYTLPPIGIEAGAVLAGIYSGEDKTWAKKNGLDLFKLVLGAFWDELLADNVPLDAMTRMGLASMAYHQYGREYAVTVWQTGLDPKAPASLAGAKSVSQPNRASRRSKSTGGATKTPSRAVTKGTTSPTM